MSPTNQDLSNDTTFSQIKSRVPVPLSLIISFRIINKSKPLLGGTFNETGRGKMPRYKKSHKTIPLCLVPTTYVFQVVQEYERAVIFR